MNAWAVKGKVWSKGENGVQDGYMILKYFAEALPGYIPKSDMAQKVATPRKMKSRQETTSLGQIATGTAKLTTNDKRDDDRHETF